MDHAEEEDSEDDSGSKNGKPKRKIGKKVIQKSQERMKKILMTAKEKG